jgi:predicted GIY-YIG superfamily endonuclease
VYLLHFARPLASGQHYVGWTSDLPKRIRRHASGTGAVETSRFAAAGIPFAIAQIWTGRTTAFEQQVKRDGAPEQCPICQRQRDLELQWERGRAELEAVGMTLNSAWLRQ